ncbi:hypothetical protein ACTQ2S_08190 [Parolsenella catena]|uniref:hypothetical protein n=1 Tax=Parolsenella catena TaxID=2003188 RepID=UPI003F95BFFC
MARYIATRAWGDASRILQRLDHDLAHMGHGYLLRGRPVVDPALVVAETDSGEPFPVAFGKPRALTAKHLARILGGDRQPSAHSVDGGWRWYQVSMPDVYGYINASSQRQDAVGHLALVASVVPYSQLTLSEAVGVTLDMMRLDPRPELGHPSKAATDWAEHGLGLIDCWQARQLRYQGRGLGDVETLARRIDALRVMCARWHVHQAEMDLAAAKDKLTAR